MKKKLGFWLVARRAVLGLCPNCGRGKLFATYLKQVDNCSVCDEAFGHIRADDGPAWLTVLVTGHLLLPVAVTVTLNTNWPDWVYMTLWPGISVVLILALLQPSKGVFIAAIWRTGCIGAEK